ncbi:MAG: hypothetical protein HY023_04610 [Chloroflexi bacterium]|nr:hypothetical protein [Chloroflexota bacterium]
MSSRNAPQVEALLEKRTKQLAQVRTALRSDRPCRNGWAEENVLVSVHARHSRR